MHTSRMKKITFSVNRENAEFFLDDKKIKITTENGKTLVCYEPKRTGNHTFKVKYGDKSWTKADFFCSDTV